MKRILTTAAALLISIAGLSVFAQSGYRVQGTVVDALGPVIGATVIEKGTTNGTSTGIDGDYVLNVSKADAMIEITCIGYKSLFFKASEVPSQVKLIEDNQFLSESVVIGYGSLSKKELSSSIVQVDKKDFFKGSMNNPMEMLTGKVAGLNVSNSASANPNSSSDLQIRGATSLSAGNGPLIVIDGMPGGDMRNLASQDIESMTVLKDAASAAIYGTRGANGVILITTRKGSKDEAGTSYITYDSYYGVNFAKKPLEVLSPDEWVRSRRGNDYGYRTNWYKELLRDFSYDHNQYVAIDGSSKKGSYNASVNYKNSTGLDLVDAREEFGGRAAIEQRAIKDIFQFNVGLNARRVNEKYGDDGQFDNALSMNPTMPVRNEDGSFYQPTSPTGALNPVEAMTSKTNHAERLYLMGTASVKANIFKNEHHSINTSINYSLNYNDYKTYYYTPSSSGASYWGGYSGRATLSYSKNWTNLVEWLLTYSLYLKDHSIQAVSGYSYEENWWNFFEASNSNFSYDNLLYNNIGAGTYLGEGKAGMSSGKSLSKIAGVFARVNYNWKDLIMFSASLRYEGSTKFGANHKWGSFPAASIAWEIANMDFMKHVKWVQSLKPRISYGVTGRSGFEPYKSLSTYSANGNYYIDGEWIKGYAPSVNANPDLGWEKLIAINAGVDFVVLNNRIRGSVDFFNRQSRDLLYRYRAPQPPFVWSDILVNVGTTENVGLEVSLDFDVFKSTKIEWTTGLNASYGVSKIKTLSNQIYNASYIEMYGKTGVGTSEHFFRYEEGSKIGEIYGFEAAGANEAGDLLVYDKDGKTVTAATANPDFKRTIGNTSPKAFLSWNNTIRYKNFDLNLLFNGAFGHHIFNMRKYGMGLSGLGSANVYRSAYTTDKNVKSAGGVISSYFLEKGDYFKLQGATLGYNLRPSSIDWINNLRIYLSAKNIYTLTGYSGSNPSIVSSNGLTPGIDINSAYPTALTLTLGATVTF